MAIRHFGLRTKCCHCFYWRFLYIFLFVSLIGRVVCFVLKCIALIQLHIVENTHTHTQEIYFWYIVCNRERERARVRVCERESERVYVFNRSQNLELFSRLCVYHTDHCVE